MVRLSMAQTRLTRVVRNLSTGIAPGIPVGPNLKDVHGKQLNLHHSRFSNLFTDNGINVSSSVRGFLSRLGQDERFRLNMHGLFKGYDVRVSNGEEAFWVAFAMSYAKNLVDRTGERSCHTIHLGQDCYTRHDRVREILAYTLLKTGICDNGGGIINWGPVDGGTMKMMGSLERAQTGKNGNWLFDTVSHKATDQTLAGCKIGMEGGVVCTDDLEASIWETMIKGEFLPLQKVEHPEQYIVNIGDITPYSTEVAARMIRARTTVSEDASTASLLADLPVAFSRDENPLVLRMEEMARAMGARVIRIDESEQIGEPTTIRDPHETDTEGVQQLIAWLNRHGQAAHVPYLDPDGDRLGIIALNGASQAVNVKGTALLKLAAHNLAIHNPDGHPAGVVADMRALMSARQLGSALTAQGHSLEVIPGVPGYNMFHLAMAEHDAPIGIEDTSHTMIRPNSHLLWGAPVHHVGTQGGDNSGLFSMYLLGLAAHMWNGRSMAQQLEHIHTQFGIPDTNVVEMKPALPQSHQMAKVAIADAIRDIGDRFASRGNYLVTPFDTGVCLESSAPGAAILVRHSKSGAGFTVGTEVIAGDDTAKAFADNLAVAMLLEAERAARDKMQDPGHPLHAIRDFELSLKDAAQLASGIADPAALIDQAIEI